MPFDIPKLKKFYKMLLKIAIVVTVVWAVVSFATFIMMTGNMNIMASPDFMTFIVIIVLEFIGHLILTGKFQPPTDMQKRPQQRRPMQRQPPMEPRPVEIKIDECAFCGREVPASRLRPFSDKYGNIILVCEDCLKEEEGKE